jgi:RNA polymerase sigma factor (sigma-70 family)
MDDYARAYGELSHRLVGVAWLIVRDAGLAADVTAEAFAKVYPRWRSGKVDDLRGYLYRAVVNEALSTSRRRRQRQVVATPGTALDFVDEVVQRDRLASALSSLSRSQRAVLVLRFYLDLSEADVAAALGWPIGTVKSTTARGLDQLRNFLKEDMTNA